MYMYFKTQWLFIVLYRKALEVKKCPGMTLLCFSLQKVGLAFSFTHLYSASPYHSDSFTSALYQTLCCIVGTVPKIIIIIKKLPFRTDLQILGMVMVVPISSIGTHYTELTKGIYLIFWNNNRGVLGIKNLVWCPVCFFDYIRPKKLDNLISLNK